MTRRIVLLGWVVGLLSLWLIVARLTPDSLGDFVGGVLYLTVGISLIADFFYVTHNNSTLGTEIGLRIGGVVLCVMTLLKFSPPDYHIQMWWVIPFSFVSAAYILEVPWRVRTLIKLSSLAARRGSAYMMVVIVRLMYVILMAVLIFVVLVILNIGLPPLIGTWAAQSALTIYLLIMLPPAILALTYGYYAVLYRLTIALPLPRLRNRGWLSFALLLIFGVMLTPTPDAQVDIHLHLETPERTIPADFLGLSFEALALNSIDFNPQNVELRQLLDNLGQGTLRFGGNSVESIDWSSMHAADLDSLFRFARAAHWRVILGLNLGNDNPALAADEAAEAIKVGGKTLLALEIGNEPDLFMLNGLRPALWSYDQFRAEFDAYRGAILARVPDAPLAGPTAYRSGWFAQFLNDEKSQLMLATQHLYPTINLPITFWGLPTTPSIDNLLSPTLMNQTVALVDPLVAEAVAQNLPLQISETNSVANWGKAGVSDTFAASLWGADYLFTLAEHGVRGINFHGRWECGSYTPICRTTAGYEAEPLYYGMLTFAETAHGEAQVIPVEITSALNVTAHALIGGDGKLRIALFNKGHIDAVIHLAGNYPSAALSRLSAPSVDATTGITLGNPESITVSTDSLIFSLPAMSGVILTIG